ncbi:putative crinkler (CRN) family protein [Phytophthora cinnamomi]|uniref:putative crinkler (CRN) family protein n=1 Tax=Phytophthora cinnamomi TaxID=4785 RepID=UPI00355A4C2B|nr:putative crinkler (CRN) family protein [Phytophthora cinnamomi]
MKDGAWFPDDAAATLQLEEGVLHPDVRAMLSVKQLKATWQIREVLAANDMAKHAPQSRQIHVVVVVQRESQLEWQSAQLRPHIYDPISKYFLREKEVMGDSGLPPSHVTLYCRPAFHMQIELLREMDTKPKSMKHRNPKRKPTAGTTEATEEETTEVTTETVETVATTDVKPEEMTGVTTQTTEEVPSTSEVTGKTTETETTGRDCIDVGQEAQV